MNSYLCSTLDRILVAYLRKFLTSFSESPFSSSIHDVLCYQIKLPKVALRLWKDKQDCLVLRRTGTGNLGTSARGFLDLLPENLPQDNSVLSTFSSRLFSLRGSKLFYWKCLNLIMQCGSSPKPGSRVGEHVHCRNFCELLDSSLGVYHSPPLTLDLFFLIIQR